ncbi:Protein DETOXIFICATION 14 [Linum perenne]
MNLASDDQTLKEEEEETLPLKQGNLHADEIPNHCQETSKGKGRSSNHRKLTIGWAWDEFSSEVKRVSSLAAPLITINLSQYFLQVISLTMVGHLGDQLSLSSSAIAISFSSVTGFSPTCGIACALETLCGQAYGAKQYRQFGVRVQTAIFSGILVCIPISVLWIYMEDLLLFIGQDPLISHEAGKFATRLIPALFAYATLQSLVRYFQMQSMTTPLVISSSFTLCFHVTLCWVLVFPCGFGSHGAAFAIGISYWFNVILLAVYMFSPACEKTRVPLSMELVKGMGEYFRYAIPSAGMICLEWWSFELLILMSGLLPNPELETSVLSLSLATMATLYTIPEGIGAAARHVLGHIFSTDKEVVDYLTTMAPLICLSVILDSVRVALSGVARGCGWQNLGAYVNLASYYICGVPLSAVLGFWMQLRGPGLWAGIQVGSFLQNILLILMTRRTDWEREVHCLTLSCYTFCFHVFDSVVVQANKTMERVFDHDIIPMEKWRSKKAGCQQADIFVVVKIVRRTETLYFLALLCYLFVLEFYSRAHLLPFSRI